MTAIGLVVPEIHNLYSLWGFFNQNYAELHVYHPQLENISGDYAFNTSQSTLTYNDVPLSPGNKATGLHGPDINSLIYCY